MPRNSPRLTCLVCGSDLTRPPTGRPPTYCGTGCRRAAENERGRLDRHLGWLARERSRLAREALIPGAYSTHVDRLAVLDAEIAAAEQRLLALLAGSSGGDVDSS